MKTRPAWRVWFAAIVAVAAIFAAVLHLGDLRKFAALAQRAEPAWLIAGLLLQVAT